MNKFIGIGILGNDPNQMTNGCSINLAFNDKKKGKVFWLKGFAFGKLAELIMVHKKKGDKILIDGSLDTSIKGDLVLLISDAQFL